MDSEPRLAGKLKAVPRRFPRFCGGRIRPRAFDTKLHRVVAIKALAPQLATSSAARQRFVREARAAAAVTHDNVIAIHAVEDQGPVPYLVMQFIDGPTLQRKLDRTGQLSLKEILRIGLQMAGGLAAAHRQGLVHRDVKPANILLENGVERVKITDFGLARAGDDASLTQSGVVAGTPTYMSPEQAQGEPVDFRSDLFNLGSVMYAMCTGRPRSFSRAFITIQSNSPRTNFVSFAGSVLRLAANVGNPSAVLNFVLGLVGSCSRMRRSPSSSPDFSSS